MILFENYKHKKTKKTQKQNTTNQNKKNKTNFFILQQYIYMHSSHKHSSHKHRSPYRFSNIRLTQQQCRLPPAKCLDVKPSKADLEEISKFSGVSLAEVKAAFKQSHKSVHMAKRKKSSTKKKSSMARGLWKGTPPANAVQNSICIFLLIMMGSSISYVLANPALRMLTWMNWLPELCSQSSVQWLSRKAVSQVTGVLSCHEAGEQFRSQLTIIYGALAAAGITQELLLHHYSKAKDLVKAILFGTAEQQQLIRTQIETEEIQRRARLTQDLAQAQMQLIQARESHAQASQAAAQASQAAAQATAQAAAPSAPLLPPTPPAAALASTVKPASPAKMFPHGKGSHQKKTKKHQKKGGRKTRYR